MDRSQITELFNDIDNDIDSFGPDIKNLSDSVDLTIKFAQLKMLTEIACQLADFNERERAHDLEAKAAKRGK